MNGYLATIYFNTGQYEKVMDCEKLKIDGTSDEMCLYQDNDVHLPNVSEIAKNEVDEEEMETEKEHQRNSHFNPSNFTSFHIKLKRALEFRDKYMIVRVINSIRHSLDNCKTVDCIWDICKVHFYDQALLIVKELGNKAEQGKAYNNFCAIFFKIGQYEKANDCHLKYLEVLQELGDKKEMKIALSNMANAYRSIGQYQEAILNYTKALQIAEDLGDKKGAATAEKYIRIMSKRIGQNQGVIVDRSKDLQLVARGMGSTKRRLQCSSCEYVGILRDNCAPEKITNRLQESLILQDGNLRDKRLNPLIVSNDTVVMVTESSTHSVIIRCTEHVIKAKCHKLFDAASNEDDAIAQDHVACQCDKIFSAIEKAFRGANLHFVTIKTCQENHLKKSYGKALVPSDVQVLTEVDSLTTQMSLIKDKMANLVVSDFTEQREAKYGEIPFNEIQLKELSELYSEYQAALRQFILIKDGLFSPTNAQDLKQRDSNSTQSNAAIEAFPHDVHQTQTNNSGVQEPKETALILKESYLVPTLLNYFSSYLTRQDWVELRFVLSPHIPENVLNSLPNDIRFFQEFLDRRLISDQDMGLLRDAFYKIERIDCVHYIDRAKEGQCLLELENAIQGQAVSGATGEIYNQSVTAVQQNRSVTDEADHIPWATGFQMTSEVVKNSGENFAGEPMHLEEEKLRKENNSVGRNNEGGQQGHETGAQGNGYNSGMPSNYENPTSISQKSFSGPVQEAAAMSPNPLQLRSNSQEGPQESFDADKNSDYHLATIRTRAGKLEGQVKHRGQCSNNATTPNESNHAGSCQDAILTTGSHKTGSHKTGSRNTGSCESENIDTGSCVTDNSNDSNALSAKNRSQDEGKLKNGNCEAGSITTGSCIGESNFNVSSNSGNFQLKGTRRKKRNGKWSKPLKFSCEHYDRYCDVQFGCCKEFWACHRCHNSNSKCEEKKLRSRDIKNIRCKSCSTVQEVSSCLSSYVYTLRLIRQISYPGQCDLKVHP